MPQPEDVTFGFEPDENPPAALPAGMDLQFAVLTVAGIVLTLLTEATQSRRHRLRTSLGLTELSRIQEFLNAFA